MPDFSKGWPDLVAKIVLAIISVFLGVNQIAEHNEHQALASNIASLQAALNQDGGSLMPTEETETYTAKNFK